MERGTPGGPCDRIHRSGKRGLADCRSVILGVDVGLILADGPVETLPMARVHRQLSEFFRCEPAHPNALVTLGGVPFWEGGSDSTGDLLRDRFWHTFRSGSGRRGGPPCRLDDPANDLISQFVGRA